MNEKEAKSLRQKARKLTIGQPYRVYLFKPTRIELSPACTRKVYKDLKKADKLGSAA